MWLEPLAGHATGRAPLQTTAAPSAAEEVTICRGTGGRKGATANSTGVAPLSVRLVLLRSGSLFVNKCVEVYEAEVEILNIVIVCLCVLANS